MGLTADDVDSLLDEAVQGQAALPPPGLGTFQDLARQHGLQVTSTTGGTHVPTSYHYRGQAVDVSGAPERMRAFAQQVRDQYGPHLSELFYDPLGGWKNGQSIGAIGGHGNHVHVAWPASPGPVDLASRAGPAVDPRVAQMGAVAQRAAAGLTPDDVDRLLDQAIGQPRTPSRPPVLPPVGPAPGPSPGLTPEGVDRLLDDAIAGSQAAPPPGPQAGRPVPEQAGPPLSGYSPSIPRPLALAPTPPERIFLQAGQQLQQTQQQADRLNAILQDPNATPAAKANAYHTLHNAPAGQPPAPGSVNARFLELQAQHAQALKDAAAAYPDRHAALQAAAAQLDREKQDLATTAQTLHIGVPWAGTLATPDQLAGYQQAIDAHNRNVAAFTAQAKWLDHVGDTLNQSLKPSPHYSQEQVIGKGVLNPFTFDVFQPRTGLQARGHAFARLVAPGNAQVDAGARAAYEEAMASGRFGAPLQIRSPQQLQEVQALQPRVSAFILVMARSLPMRGDFNQAVTDRIKGAVTPERLQEYLQRQGALTPAQQAALPSLALAARTSLLAQSGSMRAFDADFGGMLAAEVLAPVALSRLGAAGTRLFPRLAERAASLFFDPAVTTGGRIAQRGVQGAVGGAAFGAIQAPTAATIQDPSLLRQPGKLAQVTGQGAVGGALVGAGLGTLLGGLTEAVGHLAPDLAPEDVDRFVAAHVDEMRARGVPEADAQGIGARLRQVAEVPYAQQARLNRQFKADLRTYFTGKGNPFAVPGAGPRTPADFEAYIRGGAPPPPAGTPPPPPAGTPLRALPPPTPEAPAPEAAPPAPPAGAPPRPPTRLADLDPDIRALLPHDLSGATALLRQRYGLPFRAAVNAIVPLLQEARQQAAMPPTAPAPGETPPTPPAAPPLTPRPAPPADHAPIQNAADLEARFKSAFGYPDEVAHAHAELADARAEAWSAANGRPKEEWYRTRLGAVLQGGTPGAGALYQGQPAPGFYSQAERALSERMPNRASVDQITGLLKGAGVKPEELRWTGLDDWLLQKKAAGQPVSKAEVQDFLRQNAVQVQEVVKGAPIESPEIAAKRGRLQELSDREEGGETLSPAETHELNGLAHDLSLSGPNPWLAADAETRYDRSSLTLPGGENYRELLLTMPDATRPAVETTFNALQAAAQRAGLSYAPDQIYEAVGREPAASSVGRAVARAAPAEWSAFSQALTAHRNPLQGYTSGHWSEPNVLAHVRFNERTDAQGKKVLFVEEIQSDWGQSLRKERGKIASAIEEDFEGVVLRMQKAGVVKIIC